MGRCSICSRASTSPRRSIRATRRWPSRARPRGARRRCSPNDGAEAWDLGDGVLGVTFKTKANSLDPDVDRDARLAADEGRAGLPRARGLQPGRALLRRRQPVPRGDGRGQQGLGRDPQDGEGVPGRDPAAEVRERAGRGRALRDDARRRPRALLRLRRGAGRGRDVRGPRRGRRGPDPGRRGDAQHALARAGGHPRGRDGADVRAS